MGKDKLVKLGMAVGLVILVLIIYKSCFSQQKPLPSATTKTSSQTTAPKPSPKQQFKEVTGKYPTGELRRKYTVYTDKPDIKHGTYFEYYKSGNKLCQVEFKENLPVGHLVCWYDTKNQAPKSLEGNFEGGKKNGTFTEWHQSGKNKFTYTYKNGVLDGLWTEFYEDGTKMTEITYSEGTQTGVLMRYKPDGSVKYETKIIEKVPPKPATKISE